jgi:hypothetical protein
LYFQDQEVVNYVKNLKKSKGKLPPFNFNSNDNKKINVPSFNELPEQMRTNIVESKKQTPLDPAQIKKSCGCSKKNT